jgi:hypothetical protein
MPRGGRRKRPLPAPIPRRPYGRTMGLPLSLICYATVECFYSEVEEDDDGGTKAQEDPARVKRGNCVPVEGGYHGGA